MLNDDIKYLRDALGVDAEGQAWMKKSSLPLFLRSSVEVAVVNTCGISFLLARPLQNTSLPDVKRLYSQLKKWSGALAAVSVPAADARQRKALVAQGIPFICAGRQIALPFLGMASTEWGKGKLEKSANIKLPPKAQQAAIWGAQRGKNYTLANLREATNMSNSEASNAVGELVQRGMASRSKSGREVVVTPIGINELLDGHMSALSSPVLKTIWVSRCDWAEELPDAGETALADRSSLNPPAIVQKAVSWKRGKEFAAIELLEGELPDDDLLQIQVWKYDPLADDSEKVDDISLALSLASIEDERVEASIDSLFGKEYPWRKAR